jgi:DNA-binding PadR family transcriptional regulator
MATPLGSTKYFILLALAAGPQHGAGLRERIVGDTLGFYIRDSTLYDALKVLARDGYIEGAARTYRLSEKGKKMLESESRIYKRAAELAQQRLRWR